MLIIAACLGMIICSYNTIHATFKELHKSQNSKGGLSKDLAYQTLSDVEKRTIYQGQRPSVSLVSSMVGNSSLILKLVPTSLRSSFKKNTYHV